MSNLQQSYSDLRMSENGTTLARLWNTLLSRLDGARVTVKPPLLLERTPSYMVISEGLQNIGAGLTKNQILFGSPSTAWSSGATIKLKPCDATGALITGATEVYAYLQSDQSSVDINVYNAGGGQTATGCTVPTTAVVAYTFASVGTPPVATPYIFGDVFAIMPDITDSDTAENTGTSEKTAFVYDTSDHKLKMIMQWMVGTALSTRSNYLPIKTMTQVDMVTDFYVDGTNWKKKHRPNTYVIETDSDDTIVTITGGVCSG